MNLLDDFEALRCFASSCANVRVTADSVTFHWFDWFLRLWQDRGTFFVASATRGGEPIVECYGQEDLAWKWAITRIGAYTRYCLRYPAITTPHTNQDPPKGIHLTGQGINLNITPGIPAFLTTNTDTLINAYTSPTGGPLRHLTDTETWEHDPMGKGFFPNLKTLANWQGSSHGRPWLDDLCGFALDNHNIPVVTDYLFSAPPELEEYLRFDGEKYQIDRSSRGGPRQPGFSSPVFEVFVRLLILEFGPRARSYLHYAPLDIPTQIDQIAPGWKLVNDGRLTFGITSPEGKLLLTASNPYRRVELTHTAHLSLEELLNAFLDPWGGALNHYLDQDYWEGPMRSSLRRMKPYSDYDFTNYDTFIASHPWYTTDSSKTTHTP